MAHIQDEPRIRTDRQCDLIRKKLGHIEGNKAVNADGLFRIHESAKMGMECDALAGQPVKAVLDRTAGKSEISAQGSEAFGGSVAAK